MAGRRPFAFPMRTHFSRPAFIEGARDMLPMTVGLIPFGIVCGVGAISAGASPVAALAMSMIVFSGAAQIIAAQLLAAGAPFAVVVLSCFVVSLRFLMYSAALAPYLKPVDHRWRNLVAFLLTDQAFAASVRRFDAGAAPRAGGMHFLGGGFALWAFWQVTNLAGYFLGNLIPASWSLDFAVPLCFIALVAPHFRTFPTIMAGLVAAYAVIGLSGLPMNLNLIVAGVLGIAAGTLADFARERWTPR